MIPDPTLSTTTMNQFKSWNTLICGESACSTKGKVVSPLSEGNRFNDCESNPGNHNGIECAPQLRKQDDGSYLISVFDATLAIIKLAGSHRFSLLSDQNLAYIAQTISILIISVPFFHMAYLARPLSSYSPWFYLFLIFSSFTTAIYGPIYFNLFFVVIFDVKRQVLVVNFELFYFHTLS